MEEKSIECKVVKVLMSQDAGGRGTNQVRIVRWIVDGKDTGPLLEKRNLYTTKDVEERMGKAKGFNKIDATFIYDNWAEIQTLL